MISGSLKQENATKPKAGGLEVKGWIGCEEVVFIGRLAEFFCNEILETVNGSIDGEVEFFSRLNLIEMGNSDALRLQTSLSLPSRI